jgi:translation initiation factor 2 alpha subunit (eIF-2alpha)
MEITSKRPEGIEIINTLANADGNKGGSASTLTTYIGSPHYEVVVNAENNKVPERLMK